LEPITTNSPEEAIQIIKKELIPLIITDINMPNFSGEDIIQTAKDRLSHTQLIVITGLAKKSTAMACLHDGAACMIIKPFTISQVKRCLDNCIERIEIWNEVLSY
jgi:DNA-binding NtrC family response regulator